VGVPDVAVSHFVGSNVGFKKRKKELILQAWRHKNCSATPQSGDVTSYTNEAKTNNVASKKK
jgi:hypothetical protein